MTRRRYVVGLAAFAIGAASAGGLCLWRRGTAADPDAVDDSASERSGVLPRGSVDWALGMVTAADDDLIDVSGDLEMVSARHRTDARLAPLFEHLLDVVLRSDHAQADPAGACALRSLRRLGHAELATQRRHEINARRDLPQTRAALARIVERLGRPR